MTEGEGLGLSPGQARRAGALLRALVRLALELGWRWDGEVWVKPEAKAKAGAKVEVKAKPLTLSADRQA